MRAVRNALNPFSTGFARWWCRSSLRAILRGKPRSLGRAGPARPEPMEPQVRQSRIDAIERVLGPGRD